MQAQINQYIITGIVIGAVVFLFLAGLVVYFVIAYQNRQNLNEKEKENMQFAFEQEILKTEMEVKEQTLQTIATDLHDNIGQLLSLTHATLSSINLQDQPKSEQKIATALNFVNTSVKDLRQLAKLLHAENLLQQGLVKAIEQEVNWLEKTGQFDIQFLNHLEKELPISSNKSLFIFRLIQETISNIIKHAEANKISIEIGLSNKLFYCKVIDDGKGFDITKIAEQKDRGLGISNMKKRAALIGGKLDINSCPNEGTTIYIEVPYENE
ncbi:MAG: ATP-binding protein [Sediminibacterium sp.]|nr:ATP-binding protein [Sediminibacterium sp.]TXT32898.1 MAG: putative signal transduction histidine kinase [Chitinophagaceae bacterium]